MAASGGAPGIGWADDDPGPAGLQPLPQSGLLADAPPVTAPSSNDATLTWDYLTSDPRADPTQTYAPYDSDGTKSPVRPWQPNGVSLSTLVEQLPQVRIGRSQDPGPIPDVTLEGQLGAGGQGRVDLGRQHCFEREVAVKRVLSHRKGSGASHALVIEGRTIGALQHPGVVPVHVMGRDEDDNPVLVMKRIAGVSWRTLIRDPEHPAWEGHRHDPLGRHLQILDQVCNTVHFAHSQGVLHLDLKPDNVMVGAFGEVYVLDWGLAVHLDDLPERGPSGTPGYMAPEMLHEPQEMSVRTDVYLLGSMLHEVLTGLPRHTGNDVVEVLARAARSEPAVFGPKTPTELGGLVNRATALDPEERPADVPAFQRAIADFLRHRNSVGTAEEAERALEAFREALDALERDSPVPRGEGSQPVEELRWRIRRLSVEASFGFRRALKDWPENKRAAVGLDVCLRALADFELREQNVDVAASLVHELGGDEALEARVAELRRVLDDHARAAETLARVTRDSSAGIGVVQRTALMFAIHTVLGFSWLALGAAGLPITHLGVSLFGASLVATMLGGFYAFRDSLMGNQFNRQVLYSICVLALYCVFQGWAGAVMEVPIHELAVWSYATCALLFAVLGITLSRNIALLVPAPLAAAALCLAVPDRVAESLALMNFGMAPTWVAIGWLVQADEGGDLPS